MDVTNTIAALERGAKTLSSLQYAFGLLLICVGASSALSLFKGDPRILVVSLVLSFAFLVLMFIFHSATQLNYKWLVIPSVLMIYVVLSAFCLTILAMTGRYTIKIPHCFPLLEKCVATIEPIPDPKAQFKISKVLQFRASVDFTDENGIDIPR